MKAKTIGTRAIPVEQVVSVMPFVVRRRITFSDCDPAGIVYTPRFFDPIATGALELFMMELTGPSHARDPGLEKLGTPAKSVSLEFYKGVPQGALIDLTIECTSIGARTFSVAFDGHGQEREHHFSGELTLTCVDREIFRSMPVPVALIARLKPYMRQL